MAFHTLVKLNHAIILDALRARQEIRRLSMHDPLTGFPNRLMLRERLAHPCRQISSERAYSGFAVIGLDLDGFKAVYDRQGRAGGDSLLKVVVERLARTVRSPDLVCRTGGDEFVIVHAWAVSGHQPGASCPISQEVAVDAQAFYSRFQTLAIVCFDPNRGMRVKPWLSAHGGKSSHALPQHGIPEGQHLLSSAGAGEPCVVKQVARDHAPYTCSTGVTHAECAGRFPIRLRVILHTPNDGRQYTILSWKFSAIKRLSMH